MWPALPTVRAFCVWRRDLESWRRYAVSFFVAALGDPVFYLLGIGYGLGRFVSDINGVPYAVYLTPGIVAFTATSTPTFEATISSFTRMVTQNTYTAILATPCSVADIVAGEVLWAATKGTIAVAIVLAIVAAVGLVTTPLVVALLPLGFLVGLMFGAIGMVITAKAPSYDFFNYYFTFVFSVMLFFCGVFFPVDTLPPWARAIAWVLPLTHAVTVSRALVAGTFDLRVALELLWMVVVTLGAFLLAERLIRRRLLV